MTTMRITPPTTTNYRRLIAQAGYAVTRGSYTGTTDDRSDRWYIDDPASDVIDRRGPGWTSLRDAYTDLMLARASRTTDQQPKEHTP
jgi:hypothetical protein